jgi:hypothetical protein
MPERGFAKAARTGGKIGPEMEAIPPLGFKLGGILTGDDKTNGQGGSTPRTRLFRTRDALTDPVIYVSLADIFTRPRWG